MAKKRFRFLLLLFTLPLILLLINQVQTFLSQAAFKKATIVVDLTKTEKVVQPFWNSYAQGGEEPPPMLSSVTHLLKPLQPNLIRLDHIFDAYQIVKKNGNEIQFDFSLLDKTVVDILNTGATPFFSLSYMPAVFTKSGSVIDSPINWNDWKLLIQKTIEHYSGKNDKNIANVYYEVWNEPELPQFGKWNLTDQKDYRLLYFYASQAATEAQNTNTFFLGGPAVGSFYPTWTHDFITYVEQNQLKLDFYSWHRYHKKADIFQNDAKQTREILIRSRLHKEIPLILSEWGIESENTTINNSNTAAAFTVAAVSKMKSYIDQSFVFEVKDGPPTAGGKWGLFSHEKAELSLKPKPRFFVFEALSRMRGQWLQLSGEGTFVQGLASKDENGTVLVLLANYDPDENHVENVPVTFTNITPSSYTLSYSYILENKGYKQEIISTSGIIEKTFLMSPNSVLLLELSQESPLAIFIPGQTRGKNDQALVLSKNKLIFEPPQFRLRQKGSLRFDLKVLWDEKDNRSFLIFDSPFSTQSGLINRLFLAKQYKPDGQFLTFGLGSNKEDIVVSQPILGWEKNSWHHIETSWDPKYLSIKLDDNSPTIKRQEIDLRNGELLTFYPIDAAIDNLQLNLGENQLIQKTFDGIIN